MTELPTPRHGLTAVAPTICALLGLPAPAAAAGQPLPEVTRDLGRPARLLALLVDALGIATWQRHRAVAPCLTGLFTRRLEPLESVVPTKTPVCFATIASGALPAAHQVLSRQDDFAVPTIFDVLRAAGVDHAVVGRAHSSTGLLYARYAARARLSRANQEDRVLALLLSELAAGHARFLFCQLLDVDNAGHAGGPSGDGSRQAVADTDRRVRVIAAAARQAGCALLLLADHGQHDTTREDGRPRGTHDGSTPADLVVPFSWWAAAELPTR